MLVVAACAQALESLIRRPCGCFEQTSATTYPLTMAAQYFQTHSGVDPDLLKRSREMLEEGYKKLEGFESDGGGCVVLKSRRRPGRGAGYAPAHFRGVHHVLPSSRAGSSGSASHRVTRR